MGKEYYNEYYMVYVISEETGSRTKKCIYNLECLKNNEWNTCSIESSVPNSFLIIKNKCSKDHCPYSMLLGYSYYFCKCPARSEIYLTYGK